MNFTKKPLIATAIVFLVMFICSFFIHQMLLGADYAAMKGVFRPMNEISMPILALSYFIYAAAFVQVFLKGQEDRPFINEGIAFGLFMSLLIVVPLYLMNYAVMPFMPMTIVKGIIAETIALVISGIAAAYLLKK